MLINGTEVWTDGLEAAFKEFVEKYGHIKAERILDWINKASYLEQDELDKSFEEFVDSI
jgi:hypothetical protein